MALISDFLLATGAIVAAYYCYLLSKRLRKLADMDNGVGGAISALSVQVQEMTRTLDAARTVAKKSSSELSLATVEAENAARRLELLIASLHDPAGRSDADINSVLELSQKDFAETHAGDRGSVSRKYARRASAIARS